MASMISDDDLLSLPDDPELAFVDYERRYRERLNAELEASQGYNAESLQLEYINHVLAAAKALELNILSEWEVPPVNGRIHDAYQQFVSDVDHYTVQIRFKHARRVKRYSVALDPTAKAKIRHHLTQIKEVVDRLEVSEAKKEALYAKIAALEEEISRDRTRFDAVADLILEIADTGGEVAKRLEPGWKWFEAIARVIGSAKRDEEARSPSLPAPNERRRIEPPRKQIQPPKQGRNPNGTEDEIPF